jgi:hypothetical protein
MRGPFMLRRAAVPNLTDSATPVAASSSPRRRHRVVVTASS